MEVLPKSRLLRFVEQAYHLARRADARYSSKFSKRRHTLHQHIVLLCLKVLNEVDYSNPVVSATMDMVRQYISVATERPEHMVE
mgnify:FL=1